MKPNPHSPVTALLRTLCVVGALTWLSHSAGGLRVSPWDSGAAPQIHCEWVLDHLPDYPDYTDFRSPTPAAGAFAQAATAGPEIIEPYNLSIATRCSDLARLGLKLQRQNPLVPLNRALLSHRRSLRPCTDDTPPFPIRFSRA